MLPAAGGHMTAGTRLFAAFSLTQISDKFPINVFICLLTYKPHGYSQVHAGAFGFNPKTTKWSDLHRSWHRITMPVFFWHQIIGFVLFSPVLHLYKSYVPSYLQSILILPDVLFHYAPATEMIKLIQACWHEHVAATTVPLAAQTVMCRVRSVPVQCSSSSEIHYLPFWA